MQMLQHLLQLWELSLIEGRHKPDAGGDVHVRPCLSAKLPSPSYPSAARHHEGFCALLIFQPEAEALNRADRARDSSPAGLRERELIDGRNGALPLAAVRVVCTTIPSNRPPIMSEMVADDVWKILEEWKIGKWKVLEEQEIWLRLPPPA